MYTSIFRIKPRHFALSPSNTSGRAIFGPFLAWGGAGGNSTSGAGGGGGVGGPGGGGGGGGPLGVRGSARLARLTTLAGRLGWTSACCIRASILASRPCIISLMAANRSPLPCSGCACVGFGVTAGGHVWAGVLGSRAPSQTLGPAAAISADESLPRSAGLLCLS